MRLNGRRRTWPDVRNRHPKLGLAVDSVERLLLIGGLGDPGSELGRIDVYDRDGRLLRAFVLSEIIPDLEGLSSAFTHLPNFPWVSTLGYLETSGEAIIGVCEKMWVRLDVSTLEVEVTESIDSDIEVSLYAPDYKGASRKGEPSQRMAAMSVMVSTSP